MNKPIKNKLLHVYDRFSVSENDYEQLDKSVYKFQFVNKPNSVLAIVRFKKKIGLLKVNRFLFGKSIELVGGRIKDTDINEYEAMKRELHEEINVNEFDLSLFSIIHPLPNLTNEKVFVFECILHNDDILVSKNEGILDFKFYKIDEIIKLVINDKIKSSIDGYSLIKYLITKKCIIL
jgi:8-oxo-dGTP pyrophosphatase MutT (NUDIX family)